MKPSDMPDTFDMPDRYLPDWLGRCAANSSQKLAVRCGTRDVSFAELDGEASRLARRLASAGVRAGDRVALLAANGLPFALCVHALARLGAVLVPLNARLTVAELCWQLRDVRASLLVSDAVYASSAGEIARELPELAHATLADGDARAVVLADLPEAVVALRDLIDLHATQSIMYTSGTTGQPKGALITYGMHWWNAVASALNLGHNADDRWLACLPLYHIGGLSILLKSVIYGIGVVVHDHFDAEAVNQALAADQVTIISVVAVMLQRMLEALDGRTPDGPEAARYPAALRCVLLGGGPAPRPLLEDCARRAIPVVQTYGLTESCSQAATLAPADALRKLGSAGRPLLPVQLQILREGGLAGAGEPGEIALRGPTITPGYADRPEATAHALHGGWLATGDIGYLDDEGYLYVLDRRVDLIISGGENVYPAEIEALLLAHPDVVEAGVCGVADAQWGQAPIAFIQLRPGSQTTADDLRGYVAERLARYKVPRAVYLIGTLPRNSSGKLLRRALPALLPTATGA